MGPGSGTQVFMLTVSDLPTELSLAPGGLIKEKHGCMFPNDGRSRDLLSSWILVRRVLHLNTGYKGTRLTYSIHSHGVANPAGLSQSP